MTIMAQGARPARVSEEFREVLAEALPKLKDPRIGFVTVTGVKVTPDLRNAWIFYTALGHRIDVWASPWFRRHLTGALAWALHHEPLPKRRAAAP